MKKLEIILLTLILLGAFTVRLYKFSNPIADWHSWRQVDTSAVSRNFVKNGFDVLHPKFEDLSKGVSLIDNPQGYRFVEFPIYNIAQAGLYKLVGKFTLEEWGRIVAIFSSLSSIVFLYLIVKKYLGKTPAFFTAFFFAFIPYNIYYGRTILPDSSMVAATLGATYFFDLWISDLKLKILNYKFILSLVFMIAAFLLKPYALFFTLPLIYLAYRSFGFSFVKKWQLWLFMIVSLAPLGFWQVWMRQYPAGIPRNDWLFNGNGIRFKGAFFHWLFGDRIGQFILGYFGLPLVVLGIIRKVNQKEGWFFLTFILSSLLYMTVLATGNIQHDYYQILIIPTLAIFFGKGVDMLTKNGSGVFGKKTSYVTLFVSIAFMLAFGWFIIRDYYNIQHPEIIAAGRAVDRLTPKDAKVIAPYDGDTTLLYATNRSGWPVWDRGIGAFKKAGATYLVFINPTKDQFNFETLFKSIDKTPSYVIFDLNSPTPLGILELKNKQ